ncbi:blast:Glycerol-3-phosphate acyltransferase 3 [Drosophila guanche]|uniref:Blast:Glycerol-3-phosphate acyltransferase 3 n=1 Tax=Drosophila guanche TaxID=7266 RepID=A0A3B0KLJ1_DROGU|nr:blast:Glycerol-3-phosphate acyltransferase 3 [Drosophila guanche]
MWLALLIYGHVSTFRLVSLQNAYLALPGWSFGEELKRLGQRRNKQMQTPTKSQLCQQIEQRCDMITEGMALVLEDDVMTRFLCADNATLPQSRASPHQGACVCNHSNPLDVLILMCDVQYSLTGQRHYGILGVFQSSLSRVSPRMWFNKGSFAVSDVVYPMAIRYDRRYGEAY